MSIVRIVARKSSNRLKFWWLKVICCICQSNELEREIKHKTGGPNTGPKIWIKRRPKSGFKRRPQLTTDASMIMWVSTARTHTSFGRNIYQKGLRWKAPTMWERALIAQNCAKNESWSRKRLTSELLLGTDKYTYNLVVLKVCVNINRGYSETILGVLSWVTDILKP